MRRADWSGQQALSISGNPPLGPQADISRSVCVNGFRAVELLCGCVKFSIATLIRGTQSCDISYFVDSVSDHSGEKRYFNMQIKTLYLISYFFLYGLSYVILIPHLVSFEDKNIIHVLLFFPLTPSKNTPLYISFTLLVCFFFLILLFVIPDVAIEQSLIKRRILAQ